MKFGFMTWSPSHYFDRDREKKKKTLGIRQSNQVQRQYCFVFLIF